MEKRIGSCTAAIALMVTTGVQAPFAQRSTCVTIQRGDTAARLAWRLAGDASDQREPWFQIVDTSTLRVIAKRQYGRIRPGWRACIAEGRGRDGLIAARGEALPRRSQPLQPSSPDPVRTLATAGVRVWWGAMSGDGDRARVVDRRLLARQARRADRDDGLRRAVRSRVRTASDAARFQRPGCPFAIAIEAVPQATGHSARTPSGPDVSQPVGSPEERGVRRRAGVAAVERRTIRRRAAFRTRTMGDRAVSFYGGSRGWTVSILLLSWAAAAETFFAR